MINRTIQIYGHAYSPTTASITATANGVEVFSGTIPVTGTELPPPYPEAIIRPEYNVLFSFELPLTFDGLVPMTIQVASGDFIFAAVGANYNIVDGSGAVDQFYDVYPTGPDCRSNVLIDGIAPDVPPPQDAGDYWYTILEGSLFAYDLNVTAGIDNTAPIVTIQPQDQSVVEPNTASFSVEATISNGAEVSYQWQRCPISTGTWGDIVGATSATYTTGATQTAYSGTQYRAIVKTSYGPVITFSNAATLTVTA